MTGMRVLVSYATAFGSTAGIAERIGERLVHAGCEVDLRPVADVVAVDAYDAVVIGSAVHDKLWLPQARDFMKRHRAVLGRRPVWLFSVSSVGDTTSFVSPKVARALRQLQSEPRDVARFRRALGARDHRNFAGAVQPRQWGVKGLLFLKATGGRYGDHRDWSDIEEWAGGIARALSTAPTATSA
jgi:menaquinone-dependent protoporphyrinogen oxidase